MTAPSLRTPKASRQADLIVATCRDAENLLEVDVGEIVRQRVALNLLNDGKGGFGNASVASSIRAVRPETCFQSLRN
jgi:hypothetical protein